ncbi:hypothetical protein MINS_12450 [Mycolicibacterium insubricum]|nr:hypothetical protein MINS_12450 [Mycolicibacterium insubricum]
MVSVARLFPLPFTCQHEVYQPGTKDAHGNTTPTWAAPIPRACSWWPADTTEPATGPTGGDRVIADTTLVLDSTVTVDHRDRFLLDGRRHEVVGIPKDYNHGPYGITPDRIVVQLKWVG